MKGSKILFLKSIIYRPYSELITFFIAWTITGQIKISAAIGIADLLVKIFSYWGFDLLWNKITKNNYQPCVVWLTGLPSSGKTTIADALFKKLKNEDVKCIVLDGDEI